MSRPYFSLILPTRGRAAQIPYVLSSLLGQTFTDFEVVLGDNDTGPQTGEWYFSGMWPHLDERFKYVRNGNLAMWENWDKTLAYASGRYVYVIQDKAILMPHALQRLHALLEQAGPDVLVFDQQGHPPFASWNILAERALPSVAITAVPRDVAAANFLPRDVLRACAEGGWWKIFWFSPRSINSVCKLELLHGLRDRIGRVYGSPDPDISCALLQLDVADTMIKLDEVLVSFGADPAISSGLKFKTSISNSVSHINDLVANDRSSFEQMPLGFAPLFHNMLFADFKYAQRHAVKNMTGIKIRAADYWRLIESDIAELRANGVDPSGLEAGVARTRARFGGEFI